MVKLTEYLKNSYIFNRRSNYSIGSNMENNTPAAKSGGMSTFKKILLFVLGFLLLSFALQLGGVKVMNKTHEDTMIERPHG